MEINLKSSKQSSEDHAKKWCIGKEIKTIASDVSEHKRSEALKQVFETS